MSRRVYPTREEYGVVGDQVTHNPTKATWSALPRQRQPHAFRRCMLGSVLANDDDYWKGEVSAFARKLLVERLDRNVKVDQRLRAAE